MDRGVCRSTSTTSRSIIQQQFKSFTQLNLRKSAAMQKSCGSLAMNGLRAASRKAPMANSAPRRAISDITITRTGKPIIRTQGGRLVLFLSQLVSMLIDTAIDLLLEVCDSHAIGLAPYSTISRTHCYGFRRNWLLGTIHRE